MQTAIFDGGFTDPVFASQDIFRAVMDAFSRPGTTVGLGHRAAGPSPICAATSAILLTLADYDTPVWFEDADRMQDAAKWLTFHSGAPATLEPANASFVVLSGESGPDDWQNFACGTVDYPDRSATLLLPVLSLTGGPCLELSGPGIETTQRIAPSGLPDGFAQWARGNHASYPCGVDIVLVCDADAIALPRTTRIREV